MTDAPSATRHPWADVAAPDARTTLLLDAANAAGKDKPVEDLSAGVCVGDTLFLGSDEGSCLERLHRDGDRWTGHVRIDLADCLGLKSGEEADIEGLAEDDGWLWVVGSHARTRPNVDKMEGDRIAAGALGNLKDTRPRCLLARLPLADDPDCPGALRPVARTGDGPEGRRAGMLKQTKRGNALAEALAADPLLKPFTRIAAKEGGVDVEGIAVAGTRVALGMRGPVIRTYALLLELEVKFGKSGRLKLAKPPCRRLLDLEGLGIRDLKRLGDDLLILAGPTTGLDGPCAVYRWRGWLQDAPDDEDMVRLHRPERIIELPFGRGDDHPEGLAIVGRDEAGARLMVVTDGPAAWRLDHATHALQCDLFRVPA